MSYMGLILSNLIHEIQKQKRRQKEIICKNKHRYGCPEETNNTSSLNYTASFILSRGLKTIQMEIYLKI